MASFFFFLNLALVIIGNLMSETVEAAPTVGISSQFVYIKSNGQDLPVLIGHGVSLTTPLSDRLRGGAEVGFLTPVAAFHPSPTAAVNITRSVTETHFLGAALIGRYIPESEDKVLATTIAIGKVVTSGITIILNSGPSYNTSKEVWAVSAGFKIVFRMY